MHAGRGCGGSSVARETPPPARTQTRHEGTPPETHQSRLCTSGVGGASELAGLPERPALETPVTSQPVTRTGAAAVTLSALDLQGPPAALGWRPHFLQPLGRCHSPSKPLPPPRRAWGERLDLARLPPVPALRWDAPSPGQSRVSGGSTSGTHTLALVCPRLECHRPFSTVRCRRHAASEELAFTLRSGFWATHVILKAPRPRMGPVSPAPAGIPGPACWNPLGRVCRQGSGHTGLIPAVGLVHPWVSAPTSPKRLRFKILPFPHGPRAEGGTQPDPVQSLQRGGRAVWGHCLPPLAGPSS